MSQAILRCHLDYDLTQRGLLGGPAEDFYWETMYRAMRKGIPPGPWRIYELRRHCDDRPAFELRLTARLP